MSVLITYSYTVPHELLPETDAKIQNNTKQYNTKQYNTKQYKTIQYHTIQYNTRDTQRFQREIPHISQFVP